MIFLNNDVFEDFSLEKNLLNNFVKKRPYHLLKFSTIYLCKSLSLKFYRKFMLFHVYFL